MISIGNYTVQEVLMKNRTRVLVGRLREIIVHFVIKAPYSQEVYLLI